MSSRKIRVMRLLEVLVNKYVAPEFDAAPEVVEAKQYIFEYKQSRAAVRDDERLRERLHLAECRNPPL